MPHTLVKVLLLIVKITVISAETKLEAAISRLNSGCHARNLESFNEYSNTAKYTLIGEGAFGKVYSMIGDQVTKIVTLEKEAKDNDDSFARKIIKLMIEIDVLNTFNDPRKKYNKLDMDVSFKNDRNYLMKMINCFYTIEKKNGQAVKALVGMRLEKLHVPFDKFLKKYPNLNVLHLLEITKKIIRGLYQMHQYGYAHLDIKPDNIMMKSPFEPILIDFGLAMKIKNPKNNEPLTLEEIKSEVIRLSGFQGTAFYMDPLMFQGEWRFASDVYSLGAMIVRYFPTVNINEYQIYPKEHAKAYQMKGRMEDTVSLTSCVDNTKPCPFYKKDERYKYFKSIIFWLTRSNAINRLYLDFAMEKIMEAEAIYFKDCNLLFYQWKLNNIEKASNNSGNPPSCFRTREEYEKYRKQADDQFMRDLKAKKILRVI